jgi:hypothetical protein
VLRQGRRRDQGRGGPGKLIARALALSWVVDFREEIESDFSVFHGFRLGLDDILAQIEGPRFYRLARQLRHYNGAVNAAAAAKHPPAPTADQLAWLQRDATPAAAPELDPILAAVIPRGARVQHISNPQVAAAMTREGQAHGFPGVQHLT